MSYTETHRLYEVRVHGSSDADEALALQEPIARLMCPNPGHSGPCEVAWGFTLRDDAPDGDDTVTLVLGLCTSEQRAAETAEDVRRALGRSREVRVAEGAPDDFEEVLEQCRIEGTHRPK